MKFYYNDKLIRTSKNHIYTHAVINIDTGKCEGCRADKANAEAIISTKIAENEKYIRNEENAIKAMEAGKNGYYIKEGRHSWFCKFNANNSIERYKEAIEWLKQDIEYIKANWQVVELEAR